MTPSDVEMLGELNRRLPTARRKLQECLPDMPASGGGGGSGTSDRTGRIAVAILDAGSDQAWADWHTIDRIERTIIDRCRNDQPIGRQLAQLLDIVDRWAPTPRRRQALERNQRDAANDLLNRHDDHGNCVSCARDPKSFGEPFRRGLCVNCYRRIEHINAIYDCELDMPPVALVVLFRERGRVTGRDIQMAMAGIPRRDQ